MNDNHRIILANLKWGKENATPRSEFCRKTGLSDGHIQELISELRIGYGIPITATSHSQGYYRPRDNDEIDEMERENRAKADTHNYTMDRIKRYKTHYKELDREKFDKKLVTMNALKTGVKKDLYLMKANIDSAEMWYGIDTRGKEVKCVLKPTKLNAVQWLNKRQWSSWTEQKTKLRKVKTDA